MALNCSSEANRIDPTTVSIKYVVGGWLTLLFCVSGIITNIFTIVVLMHPRMRNSSTHVYLMALSACNIFLSAGLMINYSLKSIASYPELLAYLHHPDIINRNALLANQYEQFYAHVAPFTTPLLSMLLLCSTYFTVLVSGDRYFLICWPNIAEKIRTRNMALRLVLLVFILVNLYIFPHWFEYRTTKKIINMTTTSTLNNSNGFPYGNLSTIITKKTLVELTYTKLGLNKIYSSFYRSYLNIPVTFVVPFTLLALCNGSMIHKLILIRQKKKRLGRRMKADIRITTMLIVIVLTFMLCRSINLLVNLLVQLSPCLNKNSLQRFNAVAHLLIAFNGFVNFFLFAAFGQRFREMVWELFFRRGHYPFFAPLGATSTHRAGPMISTPQLDAVRRQSRRSSASEADLWAAISRRRSSATMAMLGNQVDSRQRSVSHSITNSSHLCIPTFTNGDKITNQSTSSINITESPFRPSADRDLPLTDHESNKRLTLPDTRLKQENFSSPSSLRQKTDGGTSNSNHHVKFV